MKLEEFAFPDTVIFSLLQVVFLLINEDGEQFLVLVGVLRHLHTNQPSTFEFVLLVHEGLILHLAAYLYMSNHMLLPSNVCLSIHRRCHSNAGSSSSSCSIYRNISNTDSNVLFESFAHSCLSILSLICKE